MPLFFHLLTNDYFERDFLNKLYNCTSIFSNISLPFHEVHLIEGWPRTKFLNHEQLFDVNLLARALKNEFSPSSVFYSQLTRFFTFNSQGISCFHKSDCTYLCHFYHLPFIQWLLIG